MAKDTKRGGKPDGAAHSDEYFAKQWAELQRGQKDADDAFRKRWLAWQKRNEGRAPYTPWLVVPASLADYGARPLTGGTPYWASPFIGVASPDPTGQPLAGAPNTVFARVFNLGAATSAPTTVRFYWCDPSVGLGAADAHPIGSTMVEVPAMRSLVVSCPTPWVPAYLNGGHECLFASADNPVLDPIQAPFQPWADRHFGQRNVNVLPAVAQSMRMWLPGAASAMSAELRVLALQVRALELVMGPTAVATIDHVTQRVLSGFGPIGRRAAESSKLAFVTKRIDPAAVIEAHRLHEARRAIASRGEIHGMPTDDPHAWGDVLLRLQTQAGFHEELGLDFKPLDLAGDEFVILHFSWIAAGKALGGYVVTFAHPGWFKPGPVQPPVTGGPMNAHTGRSDLRDLVIRTNPQARATLEIAEQLAAHLPIESAEALAHGVKVGGAHVPGDLVAQFAAGLFPIRNVEELVERIAALIRVVVAHGRANRASLSAPAMKLLDHLEGYGDQAPIEVLVAGGKPLFSAKPASKGDLK